MNTFANENVIAFRKVREEHGWLGNMSPHPITLDDDTVLYKTAEHFFQSLRFENPDIRELVWKSPSPMAAKMVAKKHSQFFTTLPRSERDVEHMRFALHMKLLSNPELKPKLLALAWKTIVEDCSARANQSGLFWGAALRNGQWVGENVLGRMWMEIRDVLIAENEVA